MARFCTGCGRALPAGAAFCTECGGEAPAESPAIPSAPRPAPAQTPFSQFEGPQTRGAPPSREKYGVVGTGTYFGLLLLFAIPVIGWICCAVMAFSSKNDNKKHFARAMLIWLIIGIVLAVVLSFVFRWLGGMLTDYLNAELGGQFGDLQELLEQVKQLENGGFTLPTN